MNSRILKLTVLGTFFVFAGMVFFTPVDKTNARDRRAAVLEKVRSYKAWKEVTKAPDTEPKQIPAILASPVEVDISSIAG